jgi:hypothetical protein
VFVVLTVRTLLILGFGKIEENTFRRRVTCVVALLPFTNLSGDPDQEYFVDSMVEEITTALSRIRWLFVIARIRVLHIRANRPTCAKSGANSASAMCSKEAFARPEIGCASPAN